MDMFFESTLFQKKKRLHFHEFMRQIHANLHEMKRLGEDSIPNLASKFCKETTLLCLDEFQVTDIVDAMILTRFMKELFHYPFILVTTSNRSPDHLYENGIQRQSFLPCIQLLKDKCNIFSLNSSKDYRLRGQLSLSQSFFFPVTKENNDKIDSLYYDFIKFDKMQRKVLTIFGREWKINKCSSVVAKFTFNELCFEPHSAADYIELSLNFKLIFITHIPKLTFQYRNEARRFITLLDALYENKVRIICLAECPMKDLFELEPTSPDQIYSTENRQLMDDLYGENTLLTPNQNNTLISSAIFTGNEEKFAFRRTLSRLYEMHSDIWWHNFIL